MQKMHVHLSHYLTVPRHPMWAVSNPRGYVLCPARTQHTYIYIFFFYRYIYKCVEVDTFLSVHGPPFYPASF